MAPCSFLTRSGKSCSPDNIGSHANANANRGRAMQLSVLICTAALFLWTSNSLAQTSINGRYEALTNIEQQVANFARSAYASHYPELEVGNNLIIQVSSLDPRLKLVKCKSPLKFKINSLSHSSSNVTVKTSCNDGSRWTIFIPAAVEIYRDVVVASQSLARGHRLTEDDINLQRANIMQLGNGYVSDPSRVIGMELKRSLRSLDTIKLNHVQEADVINKGDLVVLRVRSNVLVVQTEGVALSNGYVGEKIKVRNERSKRVVDGMVTGPGEVQVAAW